MTIVCVIIYSPTFCPGPHIYAYICASVSIQIIEPALMELTKSDDRAPVNATTNTNNITTTNRICCTKSTFIHQLVHNECTNSAVDHDPLLTQCINLFSLDRLLLLPLLTLSRLKYVSSLSWQPYALPDIQ